jgi:Lar family restriction alleviation protein
MNSKKISPCPFCGNNETHLHKTLETVGDNIADCYQVHCHSCHANGPLRPDRGEAIDYWNMISDRWFSVTAPVSVESPETLEESPEVSGGPRGKSGSPRGKSGSPRGKSNSLFECYGCGLLHTSQEAGCPRCCGKEWRPFR